MEPYCQASVRPVLQITPPQHHTGSAIASPVTRNPTASWVAFAGVALSMVYFAAPAAAQLDCTQDCRPTVALVPRASLGNYRLDGGVITVGAGERVILDVFLANWDPDLTGTPLVQGYEATINPATLTSGTTGRLSPYTPVCEDFYTCFKQTQAGISCETGELCPAVFFGAHETDPVFSTEHPQPVTLLDTRFVAMFHEGAADPGRPAYAGSIILQVSPDASGTFTVNLSSIPGDAFLTDTLGNTIAAEVFVPAVIEVIPGELFPPLNRFLTLQTGVPRIESAIRVTLKDLAGDFAVLNGTRMWVKPPERVSDRSNDPLSEAVESGAPGIWVSELSCSLSFPIFFQMWSDFSEPIYIHSEFIVPNSVYEVQILGSTNLPVSFETNYSEPIVFRTPAWGDAVGSLDAATQIWTRPDNSVDVSDIVAVLEVFRSAANAPVKMRVDLNPDIPDGVIDIMDIVRTLDAFGGSSYPFAPSVSNVCP